jgi:glutathione-regulated potassium-efflux system ancillary protein KefC
MTPTAQAIAAVGAAKNDKKPAARRVFLFLRQNLTRGRFPWKRLFGLRLSGMVLAGFAAEDHLWVRRMRTLTIGFLTPFYFIRAGSLVSLPAMLTAPAVFLLLLGGKVVSKIFGLYPVVGVYRKEKNERWYYILLMSTGLTFGTISALYGFSHGIVDRAQYSFLVAAVIASAVVPTMIANFAFLPRHLLPAPVPAAPPGKLEPILGEEDAGLADE